GLCRSDGTRGDRDAGTIGSKPGTAERSVATICCRARSRQWRRPAGSAGTVGLSLAASCRQILSAAEGILRSGEHLPVAGFRDARSAQIGGSAALLLAR